MHAIATTAKWAKQDGRDGQDRHRADVGLDGHARSYDGDDGLNSDEVDVKTDIDEPTATLNAGAEWPRNGVA